MEWTISTTDRNRLELADTLCRAWRGAAFDRQRALDLAFQMDPRCPDLRHTLTHLCNRLNGARH